MTDEKLAKEVLLEKKGMCNGVMPRELKKFKYESMSK